MADGKKIDTGTGGIDINGETYTFDVGVPDAQGGNQGAYSSGDINVDKQPRDLTKPTRIRLGQYLSDTTKGITPSSLPDQARGKGNRYTVSLKVGEDDIRTTSDFSTTNSEGYPADPTLADADAAGYFEPSLGRGGDIADYDKGRNSLGPARIARTKWFDSAQSKVSRGMIRTSTNNDGVLSDDRKDGNDLLKKLPVTPQAAGASVINAITGDHPIKTYSSALMRNRWSSDNKFSNNLSVPSDDTRRPIAPLDYKMGESYTSEEYLTNTIVNQRQLAAVGNVLMARASGEIGAAADSLDPTSGGFQTAASLVPGATQVLVSRVNEFELTAEDVLRSLDLTDADGDPITAGTDEGQFVNISGAQVNGSSLLSWGALNNPYDQFSGFSALGMQILAIAFVLTITLIPLLVSFAYGSPAQPNKIRDARGRNPLGRYRVTKTGIPNLSAGAIVTGFATGQLDWADLIGFSTTVYPLNRTINAGLLTFFGLDYTKQSSILLALAPSGPEAYLVFSRAIFRSFLSLVDQLKGIGAGVATSAIAALQKILSFIEFLRTTRVMRSLNVFSLLGDQVLRDNPDHFDGESDAEGNKASAGFNKGIRKSELDSLPINSKNTAFKSRLIEGEVTTGKNLRLAWSSFRAPDMLILPRGLQNAAIIDKNLGAPKYLPSVELDPKYGQKRSPYVSANEGRISRDERRAMEKELDAEFMPFYFHDIRTNEIVSFHAFLSSLGDSYTASYDSSEAIGRVEAIKTYKSTSRKIDVSFILAALSKQDYEVMWLKINKLTTMLYPQFSPGKISEDQTFTITIPFSQMISAPPMIRLRIGDLIQSNYSRFNLARLFGYADKNFRLVGADSKKAEYSALAAAPDLAEKLAVEIDKKKVNSGADGVILIGPPNFATPPDPSKPVSIPDSLPSGLVLQTTGAAKDGVIKGKVIIDPAISAESKKQLAGKYDSDNDPARKYVGKEVLANKENLLLTDTSYAAVEKGLSRSDEKLKGAIDYQDLSETFMDNNSIVRSFESAGGRGIAGFIESMSFDWYSGTTWETDDIGDRTPKMCKITLSFAPTHDITPGLDSSGMNRAPIYPVGVLKPRRNDY